jgi:hypothetical protein
MHAVHKYEKGLTDIANQIEQKATLAFPTVAEL